MTHGAWDHFTTGSEFNMRGSQHKGLSQEEGREKGQTVHRLTKAITKVHTQIAIPTKRTQRNSIRLEKKKTKL